MALFRKKKTIRINPRTRSELNQVRSSIPDDIASRCNHCGKIILQNQITADFCCPNCNEHLYFPTYKRIEWLVDENSFEEWDKEMGVRNPIDFPGYDDKLQQSKDKTGLQEAIVTGKAELSGISFALGIMDKGFIMSSMGTVVGEKLTNLFERATELGLSVVIYVASGGARMQEGILSLMQMAKVSQAVAKHSEAGLFYCPILTHPTTGGVTASFAMQGDTILAEPRAIIGFAGKRVIEQTIKTKLSEEFQKAEWVFDNGYIDRIVPRSEQIEVLQNLLLIHQIKEDD